MSFLSFLVFIIPLLVAIAVLTLVERKFLAKIQLRLGPNYHSFSGLAQPLADGLKLMFKEFILPVRADRLLFSISPIVFFFSIMFNWLFVFALTSNFSVNLDLNILLFFAISTLSTYGILMAGWSSNSSYAFLGSLRTAAQYIAYEIVLGIFLLILVPLYGVLNFFIIFNNSLYWLQYIVLIPVFYFFVISILAELNRTPFDLPEAESELVSGYNVEYSSLSFALFSLGEYGGIILVSFMLSCLFINTVFTFCIIFFSLLLLSFRAFLPRYRYDQLLQLGWNKLIPLIFSYLFIILLFCLL